MNDAIEYPKIGLTYQIRKADPIKEDDFCMNSCPENQRGFQNNAIYHLQGGQS